MGNLKHIFNFALDAINPGKQFIRVNSEIVKEAVFEFNGKTYTLHVAESSAPFDAHWKAFKPQPKEIQTDPHYWDCDCPSDMVYVHRKVDRTYCAVCNVSEDDGYPDSRTEEMERMIPYVVLYGDARGIYIAPSEQHVLRYMDKLLSLVNRFNRANNIDECEVDLILPLDEYFLGD